MSPRAGNYLRRLGMAMPIAILLLGTISYFCDFEVSCHWTPAGRDGSVAWVGFGSWQQSLLFIYVRESKTLADAWEKWFGQSARGHVVRVGLVSLTWSTRPSPSVIWWFHLVRMNYQLPLPGALVASRATTPAITYPIKQTYFQIPLWCLLLLACTYPLYRMIDLPGQRRRNRFAAGQCVACGYDLRHTPARCPECGLVAATAPPPTGPLTRFGFMWGAQRGVWRRIVLYPAFCICFSAAFSWSYFLYYRK